MYEHHHGASHIYANDIDWWLKQDVIEMILFISCAATYFERTVNARR